MRGQWVPCEQLILLLLNAYLGSALHINGLAGCRLRCGFSTLLLMLGWQVCQAYPVHALLQVAAYMRSVLHTLAQCHSHRILHRDIKPGGWLVVPAACMLRLPIEGAATLQTCNPSHSVQFYSPLVRNDIPALTSQATQCTYRPVKCAASQCPFLRSRSTPIHSRQLHAAD